MVSEKGDIPDRSEVEPDEHEPDLFCEELLGRGETIVHLRDGSTHELHGYDTHVYDKSKSSTSGIVYTQNEDEDEVWFYMDEIVSFEQH